MAAPAHINSLNITGHWVINKSLSDPTEPILAAQGLGWLVRKTISFGTIHLRIKHYQDEANVECIDAESAIAGIPGIKESRKANWTATERQDHVFGALISKLRRVDVTQLEHDFLKRGWSEDTIEHGVLHSHVESDTLKSNTIWAADQTWGFQDLQVEGIKERRYVRHVRFSGHDGTVIEARLIYDYQGPLL